jgi:hypothetical protein
MRRSREYCCAMSDRTGFEERHIEVSVSISRGRGFYRSVSIRSDGKMLQLELTRRQDGPEMRTIAIPALPGAVESAYIVSSPRTTASSLGEEWKRHRS